MSIDSKPTLPPILAPDVSEGTAQSSLSVITGILQGVSTELRVVHNTLAEDAGPESLAAHLRTAIECALTDFLEPAIRTLGRAAITTPIEAYEEWEEEEKWRPDQV